MDFNLQNLQQVRQQALENVKQQRALLPLREIFNLRLITTAPTLDKKKSKGLGGGNTTYARSILNNDFIDNIRCRNLYTNTITFVNSSNAVNMGAGSFISKTSNQGLFGVAIGYNAGEFSQQNYAIAIGNSAGRYSQGEDAVAIGCNAGITQQGSRSVSIGANAGAYLQSIDSVAIGRNAGYFSQQIENVAIGADSGFSFQGQYSVAIGSGAGYEDQGFISLNQGGAGCAVGFKTGAIRQTEYSTAIGAQASYIDDGQSATSIGYRAGAINSSDLVVNIGTRAGESNQKLFTSAVGFEAGQYGQQDFGNAIGYQAGKNNQEFSCIAIGNQAGNTDQGKISGGQCIAIGNQAGYTNQQALSICIGNQAGFSDQKDTSTVINATDVSVNALNSGLYLNPIRQINTGTSVGMLHTEPNYEVIFYSNPVKTFVIPYPKDNNKLLVHACIEGPTADVYYRGKGKIDISQTEIYLPSYVKNLCFENKDKFNIQICPIVNKDDTVIFKKYSTTDVIDGEKFIVSGEPGEFSWIVHGTRESFNPEPLKHEVIVKGDGPYTYIQN